MTAGSRNERGVSLTLTLITLVAILVIAALVVDIGRARSNARGLQSAADLAAMAASEDLGGGNVPAACRRAVNYLKTNVNGLSSLDAASFCSQSGQNVGLTTCSGGGLTQATPTATVGSVTVSVRYPVPNSEIADAQLPGARLNDGTPCQRMRVVITERQQTFFSGFTGRASIDATRSATVKATRSSGRRVPALVLLDPTGCTPLNVSGGAVVTVGSVSPAVSGSIAIDSSGTSCTGGSNTVDVSGAGSQVVAVPTTGTTRGVIELNAMSTGQTVCTAPACDPSQVVSGNLNPQPVPANGRTTRGPVDRRFNCKATYPTYHGITLAPCPDVTPPYLDNLKATLGSSGSPGATYQRWSSTRNCNPSGNITVSGNWWIDCNNFRIGNGTNLTFTGGNVVFDGSISMTGGSLNINSANPNPSLSAACVAPAVVTPCKESSSVGAGFVYVRSGGDIKATGGALNVKRSTVILDNGILQLNTGTPPVWSAPTEGPFAGLSFWAEASSTGFSVAGGSGANLQGVFFTPNAAPFKLTGGGNWGQQAAQFITYQLTISGGGVFSLSPDPSAVAVPPSKAVLIR